MNGKNTNELCYDYEIEDGFNAHHIGFGIIIYRNGKPFLQVATEEELHEIIKINK